MNQFEEFKEDILYSEEVKNAVRYGYQYRKEAEKHEAHKSVYSNACLSEAPNILLWLGKLVIDGITWDIIKKLAKDLFEKFSMSNKITGELSCLLTEERELKTFYEYVKEFNEQSMRITEEQFKYIRDEIRADYYGKECGKIFYQEHRMPTIEEYMRITREAETYADSIMISKD